AYDPLLLEAPHRRAHARIDDAKAPVPPELAREGVIGPGVALVKAADLPEEIRADEDRLIAEGPETEAVAHVRAERDEPVDRSCRIEIEAEGPADGLRSRKRRPQSIHGALPEPPVRVVEEDDLARRCLGPGVELGEKAATLLDDVVHPASRPFDRPIAAAAVREDDLVDRRPREGREAGGDLALLVERG